MAIPFKIDHFLFRPQAQLEKEITENSLHRKLEARVGKEYLDAGFI